MVKEGSGIRNGDFPAPVAHRRHRFNRDPNFGSPCQPLRHQRLERVVLLRAPGGQGGDLVPRRSIRNVVSVTPCHDVLSSLGERHDLVAGEALDVGHAVVYGLPPHAEPFGEAAPQLSLVEIPGGQLIPIQEASVNRPPDTVNALHSVPHHHVSMKLRVIGTGRELREPRRHVALSSNRPRLNPQARHPILAKNGHAVVVENGSPGRSPRR